MAQPDFSSSRSGSPENGYARTAFRKNTEVGRKRRCIRRFHQIGSSSTPALGVELAVSSRRAFSDARGVLSALKKPFRHRITFTETGNYAAYPSCELADRRGIFCVAAVVVRRSEDLLYQTRWHRAILGDHSLLGCRDGDQRRVPQAGSAINTDALTIFTNGK